MTHDEIPYRYELSTFERHIITHKIKNEKPLICTKCNIIVQNTILEIVEHFEEHDSQSVEARTKKCPNPIVAECQVEKGYKDEVIHRIRFHCMEMS